MHFAMGKYTFMTVRPKKDNLYEDKTKGDEIKKHYVMGPITKNPPPPQKKYIIILPTYIPYFF